MNLIVYQNMLYAEPSQTSYDCWQARPYRVRYRLSGTKNQCAEMKQCVQKQDTAGANKILAQIGVPLRIKRFKEHSNERQ